MIRSPSSSRLWRHCLCRCMAEEAEETTGEVAAAPSRVGKEAAAAAAAPAPVVLKAETPSSRRRICST